MVKIIGKKSGKVYAEGNKTDCFRELQKKYPYKKSKKKVYPEPLLVVRV